MSTRKVRSRKRIDQASGWIVAGLILIAWIATSWVAWMMLVAGILLAGAAGITGAWLVIRRGAQVDTARQLADWAEDEMRQINRGRKSNSATK